MIYFNCDYNEGCHPVILEALEKTNMEQTPGYGEDEHCARAARLIREACVAPDADVHFLVGGTAANLILIASALRPYQSALCADSGHINVHESGAIEASGHKVETLPGVDGRISAEQVKQAVRSYWEDETREHRTQPKLVYISNPTEYGTLYSKAELTALHEVCHEENLYLYMDGARLGYGLASPANDLTLADIARLTDAFYIGGTKVGALFGEAMVVTCAELKEGFRSVVKQRGGLLAKGRLLGIQFETLFTENRYMDISRHAVQMAMKIRDACRAKGWPFLMDSPTNQLFPIVPLIKLEQLSRKYVFLKWMNMNQTDAAIRIATSWATREEDVAALIADIEKV
ncbi:MAG: threonine aldolase family protein [Pyramidobacter sp.]|jgi:threonine aldolase